LQFEKRYELENGNIFQLLGAPAFNLLVAIFGNICVATYIWQYILDGVGAAMNGGFWQYAALQFYLQPMHTNQVAAGTIKLCFDTIATSSQILHHEYKLLRIARICKEICRGGGLFKLLHLIIKYLTPSTMHCNVTAGYKCNSN